MLAKVFPVSMLLFFSLCNLPASQNTVNELEKKPAAETGNKIAATVTTSLYTRVVPSAECGSTDNIFIYLENASVELAPGVPVWSGNPSNPQPLAWALVYSNWGTNNGTAYFILNGYVHSSFTPC
jgi:hypothetical protein